MTEGERMQNARRLAGALYRHMNTELLEMLADILAYMPEQLETDIQSLAEVLGDLPNEYE